MKADIKNTSFIIHYRKESEDHYNKLAKVLDFFHTKIDYGQLTVINDAPELDPQFLELVKQYPVNKAFCQNPESTNKCSCYEQLANKAQCPILAFYDIDVMVRPEMLQAAQDLILKDYFDHVYPYNGLVVDLAHSALRSNFLLYYNFALLERAIPYPKRKLEYKDDQTYVSSIDSLRGITFISKNAYDKMGGHDERFIRQETMEQDFFNRSKFYGNRIGRTEHEEAVCWHIKSN